MRATSPQSNPISVSHVNTSNAVSFESCLRSAPRSGGRTAFVMDAACPRRVWLNERELGLTVRVRRGALSRRASKKCASCSDFFDRIDTTCPFYARSSPGRAFADGRKRAREAGGSRVCCQPKASSRAQFMGSAPALVF